jgi:hypothetical protein
MEHVLPPANGFIPGFSLCNRCFPATGWEGKGKERKGREGERREGEGMERKRSEGEEGREGMGVRLQEGHYFYFSEQKKKI